MDGVTQQTKKGVSIGFKKENQDLIVSADYITETDITEESFNSVKNSINSKLDGLTLENQTPLKKYLNNITDNDNPLVVLTLETNNLQLLELDNNIDVDIKKGSYIYKEEPIDSSSSEKLGLVNINGKVNAKELYDNNNRVYTPETFHLYEICFDIKASLTDKNNTTPLSYIRSESSDTDTNQYNFNFKEVQIFAKKILPYKIYITKFKNSFDSARSGICFSKSNTEVTRSNNMMIIPFTNFDIINSYLKDRNDNIFDIYNINFNNTLGNNLTSENSYTFGVDSITIEKFTDTKDNLIHKKYNGYLNRYKNIRFSKHILPFCSDRLNAMTALPYTYQYLKCSEDGLSASMNISEINTPQSNGSTSSSNMNYKLDIKISITDIFH